MKKNEHPITNRNKVDTALSTGAVLISALPYLGGPVSSVLAGISANRKVERIKEFVVGLEADLIDWKSQITEDYVKTEDFEDLLERVLLAVTSERAEQKRLIFRRFLVKTMKEPGDPYDDQVKIIRLLGNLQIDHIRVLEACQRTPRHASSTLNSSRIRALSCRLPNIPVPRLEELIEDLNDLRITKLEGLKIMVMPSGAEQLEHFITPLGHSLLKYIVEE